MMSAMGDIGVEEPEIEVLPGRHPARREPRPEPAEPAPPPREPAPA
jgi:hypothetical protein